MQAGLGSSLSPLQWQGGPELRVFLQWTASDVEESWQNMRSCFASASAVFHSTPAIKASSSLSIILLSRQPEVDSDRPSCWKVSSVWVGPFSSGERYAVSRSSGSIQNVQAGRWVPLPLLNITVLRKWERLRTVFLLSDQTFEHFKFSFVVFLLLKWKTYVLIVESKNLNPLRPGST